MSRVCAGGLLLILGMFAAAVGHAAEYVYQDVRHPNAAEVVMRVSETDGVLRIAFRTAEGDWENTEIAPRSLTIIRADYLEAGGKWHASTVYDYAARQVRITGEYAVCYPLDAPVYENNGSLFYLLGRMPFPESQRCLRFRVVQSNMIRMTDAVQRWLVMQCVGPIPMRLDDEGEREMRWDGEPVTIRQYALSVDSTVLAAFWPHRYIFYYRTSDRRLLQFEGVGGKGQPVCYRLAGDTDGFANNLSTR